MRAIFYAMGCAILVVGGMGIAVLPRIAPNWWIFATVGSGAAMLVLGGWVGLRAAAGDDWPRPRTRHMLVVTGVIGAIIALQDRLWLAVFWSIMMALVGLFFSLRSGEAVEKTVDARRVDN